MPDIEPPSLLGARHGSLPRPTIARTKRHPGIQMHDFRLSRRSVLRGLGVTMALPWLESLPAWADDAGPAKPNNEPPVRLAVLFSAAMAFTRREWWAKGEGRDMQLGKVLEPLTRLSRKAALHSRPVQRSRRRRGTSTARKPATCCRVRPWPRAETFAPAPASISSSRSDIAQATKVPSLVLGLREIERLGPQELLDALQLAHFVDLADHADAARALSGPGLRPAVQGRSRPRR